jgi:hypothetical protein
MEPSLDPSSAETVAAVPGTEGSRATLFQTSSANSDEGRFIPGTLLGGRYRIIGLLGRGGMGEVYRATDLTLNQSVALKFLPTEAAGNVRLLERFHGEVRVARQVSHPNVCRVYDIGQVEGMPFISMEYVDGEDLATLLTRIGRLPADKALDTARKICAGLAAAHDRGVIHRDLKPQNIMMNRRGEVVIMDFGLAAIAESLTGAEVRNGTPGYMAPEQLKGAEVTARSDIYALGVVLYELFTGKKPYEADSIPKLIRLQESSHLTSMTSLASDIDPAVEKAIRRCLNPDPTQRPATPLAVSAALPGGDPLAAALAAGETPTPEMVAAAGETLGLPRKYSIPCLAFIALCLVGALFMHQRTSSLLNAPLDLAPEVLAAKSHELAASFGYAAKPADSFIRLQHRDDLLDYLDKAPDPRPWQQWFAAESPVEADCRESPRALVAPPEGKVTDDIPPFTVPGMSRVRMSGVGRLIEFVGVPPAAPPAQPVQADAVFRAAGYEMANFQEVPPTVTPKTASDAIRSWKGPHPVIPKAEITLTIAWWKGAVTMFKIAAPWDHPEASDHAERSVGSTVRNLVLALCLASGLIFAILLARRNWKLGRTDRKGALRLASVIFALNIVVWAGGVHPVADLDLLGYFYNAAGGWLVTAASIWMLYLAVEPSLRARWPHTIVTWNRLLAGRWLDAQVGSHILIGAAVGSFIWVGATVIQASYAAGKVMDSDFVLSIALGTRHWIASQASVLTGAIFGGLTIFFAISGLRALVRKEYLAAVISALLLTLAQAGSFDSRHLIALSALYVCIYAILVFLLLRLGLVATMATMTYVNSFNGIILGSDWKTWWAPAGIATMTLLFGVAVFAFWRSLGTQGLLGKDEANL